MANVIITEIISNSNTYGFEFLLAAIIMLMVE
jgi:hypothetical protein